MDIINNLIILFSISLNPVIMLHILYYNVNVMLF